jgi:hypothetical protein
MQASAERKKLEVELEIKRRAQEAGQRLEYTQAIADKPFFGRSFFLLVFTYCACTGICFVFPEVVVWTFNPEDDPKRFSFLWGLVNYEWKPTRIYEVTTGGLGFSLLHPICFQIGSVITGINASRR